MEHGVDRGRLREVLEKDFNKGKKYPYLKMLRP